MTQAARTAASAKTPNKYAKMGLSGDTVWIRLFKAEGNEDKEPFFGLGGTGATGQAFDYHIKIQREKWVEVPKEMADHIEGLTYTVKEPDPADPDNPDKFVWADKQRFPLQRAETEPREPQRNLRTPQPVM